MHATKKKKKKIKEKIKEKTGTGCATMFIVRSTTGPSTTMLLYSIVTTMVYVINLSSAPSFARPRILQ